MTYGYEHNKKWRKSHKEKWSACKQRYRERNKKYDINNKVHYTEEEKQRILDHSIPDVELSKELGRTPQSIQILRCKLKKELRKQTAVS